VADNKALDVKTSAVAKAIYAALDRADPSACMGPFDLDKPVIIDGDFHLYAVAAMLMISLHDLNAQALLPPAQTPETKFL
jgi:hypothetical protein